MCEKSVALIARKGRQQQRYDKQFRLVAGCIPYRLRKYEDCSGNLMDRLELLMISSPNRCDLVFPKGGWENDETVDQAARREALEEAGVRGIIHRSLGVWEFRSKSSTQKSCSLEGSCRGFIFAMEVTEELDSWPEEANHQRRWLNVMDAWKLCRYEWMREALTAFMGDLPEKPVPPHLDPISCSMKPSEPDHHLDNPINALC